LTSEPAKLTLPRWLRDDAFVVRALDAKDLRPLALEFWAGLVVLAQWVDGSIGDEATRDFVVPVNVGLLLRELAGHLPPPDIAPADPRRIGPCAMRHRPHPIADLADCATVIAGVLSDPYPSSPKQLANLLEEIAIALWLCRYTVPQRPVGHPALSIESPPQSAGDHDGCAEGEKKPTANHVTNPRFLRTDCKPGSARLHAIN